MPFSQPSLRQLAKQLNLSVATVSMALRRDPRILEETSQRVRNLAEREGYHSDPIVSEGLSRVRKGVFYRETLAWCFDQPHESLYWLKPLFQSTEDFGRHLGYQLEYFSFENQETRTLKRMADTWKARGIRGVLLGPFHQNRVDLPLPWADFTWVSLDHALIQPALHQVGRDYERDIACGLELLQKQGCRRPGFVVEDQQRKHFEDPQLKAALAYYYRKPHPLPQPYIEISTPKPELFAAWLKKNQPDSLLVSRAMHPAFVEMTGNIPMIILSEYNPQRPMEISFGANYKAWGQSAVNFMHRILTTQQSGIPECQQSVLVSSPVKSYTGTTSPPAPGKT